MQGVKSGHQEENHMDTTKDTRREGQSRPRQEGSREGQRPQGQKAPPRQRPESAQPRREQAKSSSAVKQRGYNKRYPPGGPEPSQAGRQPGGTAAPGPESTAPAAAGIGPAPPRAGQVFQRREAAPRGSGKSVPQRQAGTVPPPVRAEAGSSAQQGQAAGANTPEAPPGSAG